MKVSILGFGTVGRGVWEMINSSGFLSCGPVLDKVPSDLVRVVPSVEDVVTSDSDVVVECMGGTDVPYLFVKKCLEAGKHVVTSNKAMVASHGAELNSLAAEKGLQFLFSAACGGAIPVLHNISVARNTDTILCAGGILNGTTNFMLSGIESKKFVSYSEALSKAQQLGYAEADPTADVTGLDSLRKTILLSGVSFGILPSSGTCCEGITDIDMYKGENPVRLLGRTGLNKDGSVFAYVEPVICNKNSVFGTIESNFNAIAYEGQNSGRICLTGQGAGRYPTASAVLRDISSIKYGTCPMMAPGCRVDRADNSLTVHTYCVGVDGVFKDRTCPVEDMHMEARKMRGEGRKVFFAAYEE